jgi:hypothetical protein
VAFTLSRSYLSASFIPQGCPSATRIREAAYP